MHGFKGERVLMRILVEEQDKHKGQPLYQAIVELLRQRHYAGATVFRGTLGFGPSGHLHAEHTWTIREDLPVVIEVVDTEEKIRTVLPELDAMVGGGLITLERVRVIMYRPKVTQAERDESHDIDVTGSWRVVRPDV
jgi:uncharacterized protein